MQNVINGKNQVEFTEAMVKHLLQLNTNYTLRMEALEAIERVIQGLADGKKFNKSLESKLQKEIAFNGRARYDQRFSNIELSVETGEIVEFIRLPNDRVLNKEDTLINVRQQLQARREKLKEIGEQIAKADKLKAVVSKLNQAYNDLCVGMVEAVDQFPSLEYMISFDKAIEKCPHEFIFLGRRFK